MRGYNKNKGFFNKKNRMAFFVLFMFCGIMCPFSSIASQNSVGLTWNLDETTHTTDNSYVDESEGDTISYIFSYRNRSDVLELQLNKQAINGIDQLVKRYRRDILSKKGHFSIISYIRPCDLYLPQQINIASVQGSVARSYLKSKHNIEHGNMTFAFDTAHYTNYKVRVAYVAASILGADNQTIYYTKDKDLGTIARSTLRYKPIPLIGHNEIDELSIASNDSFPKEIINNNRVEGESIIDRAYYYRPDPRLVIIQIVKPSYRKRLYPSIAVKTNLLTWVGVMPKIECHYITPNLELEYFLGKRWSVNVDGCYTFHEMKDENKEIWIAAAVGVESRIWFNPNARFCGLYTGIYGLIGVFDSKLDPTSDKGNTGNIKEGGISLGCYLPLTSRWGVELGTRYGYRIMNYDSYVTRNIADNDYFYYQSSYVKNAFQLTGVRILVSYRFGQSSVHKIR